MNLLTYAEREENDLLQQCDPQYHPMIRSIYMQLKKANLPKSRRLAFLFDIVEQCRSHTINEEKSITNCQIYIQEEKKKLSLLQRFLLSFSDFPIILFLYTGIYEVALDALVEPLLNQSPMQYSFPLTLSLLTNTMILYVITKILMSLLLRSSSTTSFYYWLVILGCFCAFLGLTYLSRTYLTYTIFHFPTILFLILTAALAWGSLMLQRKIDHDKK